MAASRHLAGLLIMFCFAGTLVPPAVAWSNGGYSADPDNPAYGTHDWIADMALGIQTRDVAFLTTTYHSVFLLGTEAPDNPEYIGDTSNHHVYFTSTHAIEDDVCALRAAQIYQLALSYLQVNDFDNAAFDIGVLAHYVSDPGAFGHTMGAYTDWGAETHHSDYENEIDSRIGTLSQPAGLVLGDTDAYNATLSLAVDITFGNGPIQTNVWMDTNYGWTNSIFVTSAMASLNRSVTAVAAVINHLMTQNGTAPEPTPAEPIPPQPSPPGRPAGLTAVVQDLQVVLTWLAPENDGGAHITGYTVYRRTGEGDSLPIANLPGTTTSWIDDSVSRGKSYHYWVMASNSAGSSSLSDGAFVKMPEKPDSPVFPILISAASIALASAGAILWRRRSRLRTNH